LKPRGAEDEIGFRQHGSQTFGLRTEIATPPLREARNDKGEGIATPSAEQKARNDKEWDRLPQLPFINPSIDQIGEHCLSQI